ncbi:helix-turn-helix transcriptional regulator [Streptomyces sp. APSN-46.1]|uniref:helix-turn-helix transcriptional regulator n=1 Tax=Streptomyces sp. APSN-46.1 TaxID=2929049 RepID=UPI001FB31F14|nr:helix-turn-helix transcriptional regulator [Streptomyces sp. APSN-46.1]MCJ1676160.1 helix-turn-helix transcriptional regulator [Streptomyces sp. APSN-46.1]
MARGRVGEALRRLGIGDEAVRVYLALLELAPAPLSEVAAAAGMNGTRLVPAYGELLDAGLASAAISGLDTVAPLPPAAALQILSRYRAAELDASCVTVAGAFDAFQRQRQGGAGRDLVEVVTGDEIGPRLRKTWDSAREQIRQFDSPPYFPIPTATDEALATLARGVTQRVVYSRQSLEVPGRLAECIEPCVAAGEQARVAPSVPVKLIIIDDEYALVSLSIKEVDTHHTMLVVQPSGLFTALVALFEHTWQGALPFHGAAPTPRRLHPADRRLLALLSAGVTDTEIARQIGISRRTLYRRIEVLMTRLGAATRFQMALQAQRHGWL